MKANWRKGVSWTEDQYHSAQKAFVDVKDNSFEGVCCDKYLFREVDAHSVAWDESKLRQWLLDQGIVAPKGPKEHLVQSAKSMYVPIHFFCFPGLLHRVDTPSIPQRPLHIVRVPLTPRPQLSMATRFVEYFIDKVPFFFTHI